MKIFISAMVLCVLQCQAEAGRRQISPDDGDIANGSGNRQISTDDLITTSNRPGDIVSAGRKRHGDEDVMNGYGRQGFSDNTNPEDGGEKARRDELLPPGSMMGPIFSRSRNRNPPYGYGRQDSLENMITPNSGSKRRRNDGYPPDDPDIVRHRYPWNSPYGYGKQDPDDMMATPNGGERKRRRDDDMMYDPENSGYGRPWNSLYGNGRQEFPDDMMTPNGDRKRRRDDLYPPDVITDPQIRYGRPRYPAYYGYGRQDADDMITSPADPQSTRYGRPPPYPIPGRQYSTDDMNIRPFSKRNLANRLLSRDNEMTNYLIAKLKLMKDMFDYYEWGSLSAMVGRWIATLKEQQKESAVPAAANTKAPPKPPPDDNFQFYPYGRNSRQETTPVEPCGPYDTRPFCLGL